MELDNSDLKIQDSQEEAKQKAPKDEILLEYNNKRGKERRQKKRARLIVRNISYKSTDEDLRKHFEQWGKLEDINLLKRADGKLVGCKNEFIAKNSIKEEPEEKKLKLEVKEEDEIKQKKGRVKTVTVILNMMVYIMMSAVSDDDTEIEDSDQEGSEIETDVEDDDNKEEMEDKKDLKKLKEKHMSNDVQEGTAFVKFKSKESADMCLQSAAEFVLMDQVLEPYPALSREEINQQKSEKNKKNDGKDSRNLYLAREGLIMANSKAAEGVSASDMNKRHKLEQIKIQVLKNLNRFVSRNRLSIHNLPLNYDNNNLRDMVIAYTGLKPHECRVMRENKVTPEHPKGKSKGFGFMSFNTHQEALIALRKLNNNPKIFGTQHRPIVAFSIEDRAVHKVKENAKRNLN
ncbi:RNA-binding protein 28 [Eumeta japonica]|uniref:RNA-binding protein 28 n=1 Tax=Eumeta variegata TaxID=151549 RepID=A0A4C2A9R1_EUMVA|nr:RNA-binding protein 28 [Eumeta japonica]